MGGGGEGGGGGWEERYNIAERVWIDKSTIQIRLSMYGDLYRDPGFPDWIEKGSDGRSDFGRSDC